MAKVVTLVVMKGMRRRCGFTPSNASTLRCWNKFHIYNKYNVVMCVCECSCCHNINCCTAVVAPIPFIALPHATCHLPFAAFAGSVFFFNIIICCWLVYPQFCFGFVRTLRYINFRLPLFKRFFIIFAFVFVLYFFIPFFIFTLFFDFSLF